MSNINQRERITQNRVVQLFQDELGYRYLGNWHSRADNKNIERDILEQWLKGRNVSTPLIARAISTLEKAASLGSGIKLYDANKEVYRLLRYGVKEKEGSGEHTQTVWLIDWENPEANDFAIAEEVSIKGEHKKRPDVVLYVNGIALGVLELKRSTISVSEGIRQNLDNQSKDFIRNFFTTMQLVMAGNDTQGLRYGTIETPERYYLEWKEAHPEHTPQSDASIPQYISNLAASNELLDTHLYHFCNKQRFLDIIHNFLVYDMGIKKTCRHNQFFGVQSTKRYLAERKDGIIWHTQGSGKSLTMVWLAKWIRENIENSRVLVITDRTELDEQIEGVFSGIDEEIYRTKSGADLINNLNQPNPWLMCSLVHKFGRQGDSDDDDSGSTDDFIRDLKNSLSSNFSAKGDIYVFVDECHRTQSGRLHNAMTTLLPNATFIGFTGTPLLKKDQQKSIEVFGPYIHTYKFDEAVADGVVLDLRYEARDIDQQLLSPDKIDKWFDAKTRGLTNIAKTQLKQKWGTMQRVLSSHSRLEQIKNDILYDMETRPRLADGRGNAMLVCGSIYQACKVYEMFSHTHLKDKIAIITSYQPTADSIKGEETGEGTTEKLFKYATYRKMIAEYYDIDEQEAGAKVEDFEKEVKKRFVDEPGQMRLLIVVDKLLTGFDAPSATYLYIDKKMADHNLFQAICRVNRLDGEDKEYGYIIDYQDLFQSLDKAISSYTQGAFSDYDSKDIEGLLKNRLESAKQDLDNALEMVRGLCEPVKYPKNTQDYYAYFCSTDDASIDEKLEKEQLRVTLYKSVAKLLRAYANIANEMADCGYDAAEITRIQNDVKHFESVRESIKMMSADMLDMKLYEPAMRHLLDSYIRAEPSDTVMDFEELGLIELIVVKGTDELIKALPDNIANDESNVAETIENNVRKTIVDENPVNPKYYEHMSILLDELITLRRQKALDYKEYLEKIRELSSKVLRPNGANSNYPESINTNAKRALYDNLDQNEELADKLDAAVRLNKQADWQGHLLKERKIANTVRETFALYSVDINIEEIMALIKAQPEYK
ncbi:type I restriction endonuclease subunit R [Psychrobacter sp. van23A]|uniref:type I restriction endonuclease subunit R n=1 Tax=Psychrobacter sp. van23A TaxID=3064892 RepID=UPI0027BA1152|nr:HsdR family type I site-specific deoxyribonuclease [Psychrobacter sp. van23A]WLW65223.1 HsdR family type I site-specific deoxyribonuclease [Psychrobacter sp. van23A]